MREPAARTGRRLLWFIALWAGGVATVGAIAFLLRLAIGA